MQHINLTKEFYIKYVKDSNKNQCKEIDNPIKVGSRLEQALQKKDRQTVQSIGKAEIYKKNSWNFWPKSL